MTRLIPRLTRGYIIYNIEYEVIFYTYLEAFSLSLSPSVRLTSFNSLLLSQDTPVVFKHSVNKTVTVLHTSTTTTVYQEVICNHTTCHVY